MKKQYLVQFQNKFDEEQNVWENAVLRYSNGEKRYASSLEEANLWLDRAVKDGIKLASKKHVLGTPPFSLESEPNENMLVINTKIRKRLVSEWEEV